MSKNERSPKERRGKLLDEQREAWLARNPEPSAEGSSAPFQSDGGIPVHRLYTPLDLEERRFEYLGDLGFPGEYPFTRGIDPNMYRKELPKVRQYSGFATPEETNELLKNLIREGQNAFSMAFDLPTQLGFDSDSRMAHGEVGKTGLVINSLEDWERAFEGIDIGRFFINSVANAQATVIFSMLLSLAEKRGLDRTTLKGSMQNDIIKEFTTRGNFIFPVHPSIRLTVDIIEYCTKYIPQFWPVNVMGIHYAEAGANRVHEGAFVLATAFCYLEQALKRGLKAEDVARSFSFAPSQNHTDFFGEICKLRAMRRMWARLLKERYKVENPDFLKMRMTAINGGSVMTRNPEYNIVRNTVAGLIGFLAGAQQSSLRTVDEAFGIPSEEAQIITTRIQQILLYETKLGGTVDPLGGGYFVESLTSDYEKEIGRELDRIDSMGGMAAAVEKGYVQRELMKDAYELQRKIDSGETKVVGSNLFSTVDKVHKRIPYRADPKVEEAQILKLRELRRRRDQGAVGRALDHLRKAAERSGENLVPFVTECVKSYVTGGEICSALRDAFGQYKEPKLF